jgi:hypothetical protein
MQAGPALAAVAAAVRTQASRLCAREARWSGRKALVLYMRVS